MIISFILSAMMLATLGAGLALRRRAPAIGLAIALAATAGLYFIWVPDHLTMVAEAVGVGRGTDLLLYLWVSLTMLAFAGLVLELRHLQRQLTLLAREQALSRARAESAGELPVAGIREEPQAANDATPSPP
jgi:hypothetical protein